MTEWIENAGGVCWEQSGLLADAGLLHGVTGRQGGVSAAPYDSLNLSFTAGDSAMAVLENRRRLCCAAGFPLTAMTVANPCGGGHVAAVGEAERGSGAGSSLSALARADAVLTQLPDTALTVLAADDVPVILYDPVRHVCAVSVAGWQGTAAKAAAKAVLAMEFAYGTRPCNVLAYIGPSVGAAHCRVSEAMAVSMESMGEEYAACISRGSRRTADLRKAHYLMLCGAGVLPEHIDVSKSCTFEQDSRFFSGRRSCGRTGYMAAFAVLK